MDYQIYCGDSTVFLLEQVSDSSIDAIVCDPPYACVDREYGYWSESEWFDLMKLQIEQYKRVLKPTGSAMLVIQPNTESRGKMRKWVWEFMIYCCDNWNVIQDVYWWNYTTLPSGYATQGGLLRPSVKYIVWLGGANFYCNQEAVLWDESDDNRVKRHALRAKLDKPSRVIQPSGHSVDRTAIAEACLRRGGVTPYNLLPFANADSVNSSGAMGHGAGTPVNLCDWMIRYITPDLGTVLDPFMGAATIGVATLSQQRGLKYIGVEQCQKFYDIAEKRLESADRMYSRQLRLF